ncbi:hypothetical protein JMF89_17215, partial [Clostridiaceae bacterium UIB06]|nr:hypothetical protein [Clostridiaceae bacterium UIB06]
MKNKNIASAFLGLAVFSTSYIKLQMLSSIARACEVNSKYYSQNKLISKTNSKPIPLATIAATQDDEVPPSISKVYASESWWNNTGTELHDGTKGISNKNDIVIEFNDKDIVKSSASGTIYAGVGSLANSLISLV